MKYSEWEIRHDSANDGAAGAREREYGANALIVCDNLVRIYQVEEIEVQALQGLNLLVDRGEMIAIVGASGSGKSTLLNVLSGLDVQTAGRARVGEWDLQSMSPRDRLTYRRRVVGFVWQQTGRNLLPYLSAAENVALPMAFVGTPRTDDTIEPWSCSTRWAWRTRLNGGPENSPAANSSAWRSPSPWRTRRRPLRRRTDG